MPSPIPWFGNDMFDALIIIMQELVTGDTRFGCVADEALAELLDEMRDDNFALLRHMYSPDYMPPETIRVLKNIQTGQTSTWQELREVPVVSETSGKAGVYIHLVIRRRGNLDQLLYYVGKGASSAADEKDNEDEHTIKVRSLFERVVGHHAKVLELYRAGKLDPCRHYLNMFKEYDEHNEIIWSSWGVGMDFGKEIWGQLRNLGPNSTLDTKTKNLKIDAFTRAHEFMTASSILAEIYNRDISRAVNKQSAYLPTVVQNPALFNCNDQKILYRKSAPISNIPPRSFQRWIDEFHTRARPLRPLPPPPRITLRLQPPHPLSFPQYRGATTFDPTSSIAPVPLLDPQERHVREFAVKREEAEQGMMQANRKLGFMDLGGVEVDLDRAEQKHTLIETLLRAEGLGKRIGRDGEIAWGWAGDKASTYVDYEMRDRTRSLDTGSNDITGNQVTVKLRVDGLANGGLIKLSTCHLLVEWQMRSITIDYCEKTCLEYDQTHPLRNTHRQFVHFVSFLNDLLRWGRFILGQVEIKGFHALARDGWDAQATHTQLGGVIDATDLDALERQLGWEEAERKSGLEVVRRVIGVQRGYAVKRRVKKGWVKVECGRESKMSIPPILQSLPTSSPLDRYLPSILIPLFTPRPKLETVGERLLTRSRVPVIDPFSAAGLLDGLDRESPNQARMMISETERLVWPVVIVGDDLRVNKDWEGRSRWTQSFAQITIGIQKLCMRYILSGILISSVLVVDDYSLKMEVVDPASWSRVGMECETAEGMYREGSVMIIRGGRECECVECDGW